MLCLTGKRQKHGKSSSSFFYDPVQRVLRGHKFVHNSFLMQNTLKLKYCQPNVILALHVTYRIHR